MTQPPLDGALGGRYTPERELGRGGMATVYLAEDVRHRRRVALKVLHPELSAILGSERFLQEIELTANLQHPHILPLFDSGSAGGQLFYVMPFVEGETLRARLERETQLPLDDALRIGGEVADALAYAHERGVVHRDVKPENILLHGGHALVADFGIALAVQQAGGQRMTQTGLSLGTPQYMAPEQAMGDKAVDHRADIYALAAVTYEMLTGEPPHTGPSAQAIVAKVLTEPVRPVRSLRPTVSEQVDGAIQMALQKLPADRFSSVREFSETLRGGAGTRQFTARMEAAAGSLSPVRRRGGLVVGVVVVGAALGLGWALGRSRPAAEASSPVLSVPLAFPVASEAAIGGATMALSSDGTQLAYVAPDSLGTGKLVVRRLDASREVTIEVDAGAAAFSPDGKMLAYTTPGSIKVAPSAGGTARVVVPSFGARGITWIDDSTIVFSVRGALGRAVVGRSGLDTLPGTLADPVAYAQTWAVTHDLLLVQRSPSAGQPAEIGVYSISRGAFRSFGFRGGAPKYVAPGIVLFTNDGSLWGVEVDPKTLTPRGAPKAVVDGQAGGRVAGYAVSNAGMVIVRRSTAGVGRRLVVVDRAGTGTREVRRERSLYRSVRFSPDGTRILYSVALRASLGGDIYVTGIDGGSTTRFTSDSIYLAPEWSRDGSRVIFTTLRRQGNAASHILAVAATGGGTPDTLLTRPHSIYEVDLTPDGSRILWREDVGANSRDILSAAPHRADSTRPERTTQFDERGIALSPDGQWYLYTSNETTRSDVYLSRLGGDGARWPVSRSGGAEPRWARNGEVFYRTPDSVFTTRITLGATPRIEPPRALFADRSYYIGLESVWDVSPDGRRFVFVRVEDDGNTRLDLLTNWISTWRQP